MIRISDSIDAESDVVTVKEVSSNEWRKRFGARTVEITRTITIKIAAPIVSGACDRCGADFPLPDENGARFITENCDLGGNRLHFPEDEDCDKDRDRYPVAGARRIDGETWCAKCVADLKRFKGKQRRAGNR